MRLLLIDGHYYMYRSFFAIRDLKNSRGEMTNAIYGFFKTVRKMIRDTNPTLAAVLWDMGLPKRRVELQPEYKATRSETPEDLRNQIEFVQKHVADMGLASIGVPDTEADDLIATYAVEARAQGGEVVLATNDKDLFQLVDEKCCVYTTNKADSDPATGYGLLKEEQVRVKWGVAPQQIGEVLALIGDTVDNIPGVEGIGPKTAVSLLTEYGSLDALLANLDRVKNERIRGKLQAAVQQVHNNREMVRLDLDLPLPRPLAELTIQPRWPEFVAALERCDFKGLLAEVKAEAEKAGAILPCTPAPVAVSGELELGLPAPVPKKPKGGKAKDQGEFLL